MTRPYVVHRDGTVTHREAGHVVGRVVLESDGWAGYGLGDAPIPGGYWNGRKYAAQAVWKAYREQVERG